MVKKMPGEELVGTAYEPLFNPHDFGVEQAEIPGRRHSDGAKAAEKT